MFKVMHRFIFVHMLPTVISFHEKGPGHLLLFAYFRGEHDVPNDDNTFTKQAHRESKCCSLALSAGSHRAFWPLPLAASVIVVSVLLGFFLFALGFRPPKR
jgi:hypothetical protein